MVTVTDPNRNDLNEPPQIGTAVASQRGDDGGNVLEGDAPNDELLGLGGDDILHGRSGDDELIGGDGNDDLFGEAGDDVLVGGDGFDGLDGGPGDDTLTGGPDTDQQGDMFAFHPDQGNDRITDFNPDSNDAFFLDTTAPSVYQDILDNGSETPEGDAVLTYSGTTITLTGVPLAELTLSDFFLVL